MKTITAVLTLTIPVVLLVSGGLVTKGILNPPHENVFAGKSGDELSYMKGIGRYCYTVNSDKTACELFMKAYVEVKSKESPEVAMVSGGLTDAGREFNRNDVDPSKPLAVKAIENIYNSVTGK